MRCPLPFRGEHTALEQLPDEDGSKTLYQSAQYKVPQDKQPQGTVTISVSFLLVCLKSDSNQLLWDGLD